MRGLFKNRKLLDTNEESTLQARSRFQTLDYKARSNPEEHARKAALTSSTIHASKSVASLENVSQNVLKLSADAGTVI